MKNPLCAYGSSGNITSFVFSLSIHNFWKTKILALLRYWTDVLFLLDWILETLWAIVPPFYLVICQYTCMLSLSDSNLKPSKWNAPAIAICNQLWLYHAITLNYFLDFWDICFSCYMYSVTNQPTSTPKNYIIKYLIKFLIDKHHPINSDQ